MAQTDMLNLCLPPQYISQVQARRSLLMPALSSPESRLRIRLISAASQLSINLMLNLLINLCSICCNHSGMKLTKDKQDRKRRQTSETEAGLGDGDGGRQARTRARYNSTSTAAAVDMNLKRQHCALDFDTLDCPICLEALFPPVYQCQNGHMACAGCCKMLDKGSCPSCALPIGTNRCIAVEKIIESLHVNCKYAVWGCKEMLQYASKQGEHETLCKFRPFICPIMGCNHEGLKSSLREHFQSVHNVAEVEQSYQNDETKYAIKFLTKERAFDKCDSEYALIQAFEYDDEDKDKSENGSLFLVHLQFHQKPCSFSFACTSFGATKTLTRYHLAFTFERTGGFRDQHSTEGPIHDNQVHDALHNNKGAQQGYLLVPKLHLPAKEGLLKIQQRPISYTSDLRRRVQDLLLKPQITY